MDMTTREQLLEQALELFRREGYENTGVQKIVDAVGVEKPTLYHYFGSKRGLLDTLLATYFDPFWAPLQQAADHKGDVPYQLEQITLAYFKFAREHLNFYQWYLSIIPAPAESDTGKAVRPILDKQWKLLNRLFKDAAEFHGNMRGREARYTYTFLGIINTTITSAMFDLVSLNEESAYITSGQFMHGIFS